MTENYHIDGDIACGGNSTVGRDLKVQGKSTLKGDVKIEGWLDAENIKTPCKGLFSTIEELEKTYAKPIDGWYALVGTDIPADIYKVSEGKWTPTGQKGGEIHVGGADKETVENLASTIEDHETRITENKTRIDNVGTIANQLEESIGREISRVDGNINLNTGKINTIQTALENQNVVINSRIASVATTATEANRTATDAESKADYAQRSINVLQDFVSFFPPPFVKVSVPANQINLGNATNINKICYNSLTSTFVAEDVRGNYFPTWSLGLLYGANSNSHGVLPTLGKLYFETDSCKYYRMGATELEPVD